MVNSPAAPQFPVEASVIIPVADMLPAGDNADALLCGESASSGTGARGDSVEMEEEPPGDMAAMALSGDRGAEGVLDL